MMKNMKKRYEKIVCSACHSVFVKSMSFHVPQFAILPGGAIYRINPDQAMITVDTASEKLVKLLRLNPFLTFAITFKPSNFQVANIRISGSI